MSDRHNWPEDAATVQSWIDEAYLGEDVVLPDYSRDSFAKNRTCDEWTD